MSEELDLAKPLRKLAEVDVAATKTDVETAERRWQARSERRHKAAAKANAAAGTSTTAQRAKATQKSSYPAPETTRTEAWARSMDEYFARHSMPVRTRYNPQSGYGLVATRPIRRGEVVVRECIFLGTVCENVKDRVCSTCFRHVLAQPKDRFRAARLPISPESQPPLEGNDSDPCALTVRCEKCVQVYFCSTACRDESKARDLHSEIECNALAFLGTDAIHPNDVISDLLRQAIRILSIRAKRLQLLPLPGEPQLRNSYENIAKNLAYSPTLADDNDHTLKFVVKFANELVPAAVRIPGPEFLDIFHRHQCNAFSMLGPGRMDTMYGAYTACWHLMNHSCAPVLMREHHAFHRPLVDGLPHFEARAVIDVAEGTEITWCYSNIRNPKAERREHLRQFYGFLCECPRCTGPDERRVLEGFPEHRRMLCRRHNCGFVMPGDPSAEDDGILGYCNQCGLVRRAGDDDVDEDDNVDAAQQGHC